MNIIARFLPSLVPGLTALLNPWVLLGIAAVAIAGFTAGWKVESYRWDASLKDIAEANVAYIKAFISNDTKVNAAVSSRLAADRIKLQADVSNFQRKFRNVRATGPLIAVSEPSAVDGASVPGPQGLRLSDRIAVCDARCIGLYHDGLEQGLPGAYGSWRTDADAGAPGTIEADELIVNAAENFALSNKFRSQILSWQKLACSKGWWSGGECGKVK